MGEKQPGLYFGFIGETILIEDLVGPKSFGDLQLLLEVMGHC